MTIRCPYPDCGQILLDANVNIHTYPKHGVRYSTWVRKKAEPEKSKPGAEQRSLIQRVKRLWLGK